ncbi:MAG: hypothetical protein ACOYNI_05125 [Acidimicrobiia bacterium]
MRTIDDLELELRKLPGVRSAGFSERDDMLFVQLHVGDDVVDSSVPMQAARIAYRNSDRPVALELVRWRTVEVPVGVAEAAPGGMPAAVEAPAPFTSVAAVKTADDEVEIDLVAAADDVIAEMADTRARLLAVLTFPDTDEVEVHLTHDSRRAIGRAEANHGLVAAAEATLDAIQQLAPTVEFDAAWARTLESSTGQGFLVAVEVVGPGDSRLHGIATGSSPVEAAARATLHAANRAFSRDAAAN